MKRLNLGSSHKLLPDYINVDLEPLSGAEVIHDLNVAPWPFEDNSVSEINMSHILEHLGETVAQFRTVMQEMYRVCCDGAVIHIAVPSVWCNNFVSDPTHVRPITHDLLILFSKKACADLKAQGAANTPLAVYWQVDYEITRSNVLIDPLYHDYINQPGFDEMMRSKLNIIVELQFDLRVVKDDPEAARRAGVIRDYNPETDGDVKGIEDATDEVRVLQPHLSGGL